MMQALAELALARKLLMLSIYVDATWHRDTFGFCTFSMCKTDSGVQISWNNTRDEQANFLKKNRRDSKHICMPHYGLAQHAHVHAHEAHNMRGRGT
jgi:hypothetical protein